MNLSPAKLARISTGSAQADAILGGGFPARSVNVIMGSPGTGKTIFVEQLMFANAAPGRPILYLTTLSEPLTKVLTYLQQFEFYDEMKLGTEIVYEDLGEVLARDGLAALVPLVRARISSVRPKILIIDSFRALHDLAVSVAEMRIFFYELVGLLTAYDTTAFLVGEYTDDHMRALPEFAFADGIVQFMRNSLADRDERYMRVLKLRGSGYREGLHAFYLSQSGLHVFPRLVTPAVPVDYEILAERVTTGVRGLDPIIEGGLWRGSTTLIVGPTGSGKTTLALQFAVEGLRRNQPSLYVNLQENPAQTTRQIRALGEDPATIADRGLFLLYASPVELKIDSLIVQIFEMLERHALERVVIDSVGDLESAASDQSRLRDFLYALKQHFAVHRTSCILTFETLRDADSSQLRFGSLADNVVELALAPEQQAARTLAVVKARASAHDLAPHVLHIGPIGASVGDRVAR